MIRLVVSSSNPWHQRGDSIELAIVYTESECHYEDNWGGPFTTSGRVMIIPVLASPAAPSEHSVDISGVADWGTPPLWAWLCVRRPAARYVSFAMSPNLFRMNMLTSPLIHNQDYEY